MFKYPFLASEIISLDSEIITQKLFNCQLDLNSTPLFVTLLLQFNNFNEISTLPGYIQKIANKHIQNHPARIIELIDNHYETLIPKLVSKISNDSISEILFKILMINKEEFNSNRDKIISEIFKVMQNFEEEIIKNSLKLLTRIIKSLHKVSNCESHFGKIIGKENLNMIESILIEAYKTDSREKNKSIESIFIFYSNLLSCLVESSKIEEITSNYEEYETDVTTFANTNTTENEEFVSKESKETKETKSNPIFALLSQEIKLNLSEYFKNLFPAIYEIANNIKKKESINQIQHFKFTIIPVSMVYLIYLDILIYLILIPINFSEILSKNAIEILLNDCITFTNNSFMLNKILKIFELILFSKSNEQIVFDLNLILNKQNFEILLSTVNLTEYLSIEKKVISNKDHTSGNYSQLIKLLNYFYVSMKNLNSNELNELNLSYFEEFLFTYLELSNKHLLSSEIQSIDDLKNAGDEEIKIKKEQNCKNLIYLIYSL